MPPRDDPAGAAAVDTQARVDRVVAEIAEGLTAVEVDEQVLAAAFARIGSVSFVTEEERRAVELGYLRVFDALIAAAPAESTEGLTAERSRLREQFDHRRGGPDSLFARVNEIVFRVATAITSDDADDEVIEKAMAELNDLPDASSAQDAASLFTGLVRLSSLGVAVVWLNGEAAEASSLTPSLAVAREVELALSRDGFDPHRLEEAARQIEARPIETAEERAEVLAGLQLIVGLGLLSRPDASPALEPIVDRVVQLTAEAAGAAGDAVGTDEEEAEGLGDQPSTSDEILGDFAASLERDGFSQSALDLAVEQIRQLAEEGEADLDSMLAVLDLALRYAPPEAATALTVARDGLVEMAETLPDAAPLTPEEFKAEAGAATKALEASLEAGESPEVALTRWTFAFQSLAARISDEDDDDGAFAAALEEVMSEIPRILAPYVPEGMEHTWADTGGMLQTLGGAIAAVDSEDEVGEAVFRGQLQGRFDAMEHAVDLETALPAGEVPAHLRQFLELLAPLMRRFVDPSLSDNLAEADEAELARISKRFDDTLRLVRAAPTEAQIVHHQRGGLRRSLHELRAFERRRHLTVAYPDFPIDDVTTDANRVFFSGSAPVADLVRQACERLHLSVAEKRGVESRTDGRWQRLRGSAIAVLDYSAYDPDRADPGAVPDSDDAEAEVLAAAGPTAVVAYETGWTYALGTPTVVVTREHWPAPFDIDVEPVELAGDERDVERLITGMQVALYGTQRLEPGDCLEETVDHVRTSARGHDDALVHELLDGLADTRDATRVRFVLESVLERLKVDGPLLILPSRPGAYPDEERPQLFHVSGFRDWAAVAQEEARGACDRAGIEYGIGSARLNPDIVESIWLDICRASHVLADITNLNPNAVLELAMAQALGRPTLIITQNSRPHAHLPAIEKVRTHLYDPVGGRAELAVLLDRFLAGIDE